MRTCDILPPTADTLLGFAAYLFREVKHDGTPTYSYGSIKTYVCHVKSLCNTLGIDRSAFTCARLDMTLRSIRKKRPSKKREERIPVTINLLEDFLTHLDPECPEHLMLMAALSTGIYGLFRSGEISLKKDVHPDDVLRRGDVLFDRGQKRVDITLRMSKTDPLRNGATITLFYNGSKTCPYTLLDKWWNSSPDKSPMAALFQRADGTPLQYSHLHNAIKWLAVQCGFKASSFGGHSLRIGGATTLAQLGTPAHIIQQLGRWRSLSYQLYTRLSDSWRASISQQMGATHSREDGYFGGISNVKAFQLSLDNIGTAFSSHRN
jgi:integrase